MQLLIDYTELQRILINYYLLSTAALLHMHCEWTATNLFLVPFDGEIVGSFNENTFICFCECLKPGKTAVYEALKTPLPSDVTSTGTSAFLPYMDTVGRALLSGELNASEASMRNSLSARTLLKGVRFSIRN